MTSLMEEERKTTHNDPIEKIKIHINSEDSNNANYLHRNPYVYTGEAKKIKKTVCDSRGWHEQFFTQNSH